MKGSIDMKKANRFSLAAVLVLFVATIPLSRAQGMGGMDMKDMDMKGMDMGKKPDAVAQTVHTATGVVKKVDPKAGTVTLAHDPVKSLNWSAMTMSFGVKDKAFLDKLQPGKKVEVEFVQQGKDYVITSVK
jgi:Cu(I)/Ag(I) efflux system protein CusF